MNLTGRETSILYILAQYPEAPTNHELIETLSYPVQQIAKGIIGQDWKST